ncbi:STAS domain-containing protein [Caldicoprobacter algeriensis]|uniref:STAS domain-containing protein n=1 Tax=Caldicoprobacter algeriensis TaxID=699281 RepID=UPI0020794D8C|nr:STAS domain-containing protein [Caldicoprobacter algeriensis]MCM8900737.1 STAS domain-containing protein [Caldicoprobacter algeriensis]
MKEVIVSRLDELVGRLAKKDEQIKAWKDFLVDFSSNYSNENFTEELKKFLSNLLQYISGKELIDGIEMLHTEINGFPAIDVYKTAVEVFEDIKRENQMRITELRNILAELATPIIHLWQDILLVPIIGTLDSQRAQNMAEKLLEATAETRAKVVIVDVTGVPVIDTIVGGFLIEMFSAVKLLGSDVILTGIKPEIAHTLVKLGVDFNMVIIKRDLENALKYAISISSEDNSRRLLRLKRGNENEE